MVTLKNIPVVVLTTSDAEKDILEAYGLHANAYVTKPFDFDQFIKVVRSFENFWLEIERLHRNKVRNLLIYSENI